MLTEMYTVTKNAYSKGKKMKPFHGLCLYTANKEDALACAVNDHTFIKLKKQPHSLAM